MIDTCKNKNLNHQFANNLKGYLSRFIYSNAAKLSLGDKVLIVARSAK